MSIATSTPADPALAKIASRLCELERAVNPTLAVGVKTLMLATLASSAA
jgi:hypothetical protein